MATVDNAVSCSQSESTSSGGGPQELLKDIKKTKDKLEKLEQAIETITTGDDAAVEALVKQLRFKDGDEALNYLRPEKARLQEKENICAPPASFAFRLERLAPISTISRLPTPFTISPPVH